MDVNIVADGYDEKIHMLNMTYNRLIDSLARSYNTTIIYTAKLWYGVICYDDDNPIRQFFYHDAHNDVFTPDQVNGIAEFLRLILDTSDDIIMYDMSTLYSDVVKVNDTELTVKPGDKTYFRPLRPFVSVTISDEDTLELKSIITKMIELFQYAEDNNIPVKYC